MTRQAMPSFLVLCLLLTPSLPAAAQTDTPAVITQFQLLILPTTGDVMTVAPVVLPTTTSIGATQNCGIDMVAPPPTGTVVNPPLFALDDPFTAGKKCRLSFPTGLPVGSYRWAGVFIAASCNPTGTAVVSPCPGPRAVGQPPFSIANRVLTPAAATGLSFTQ